MQLPLDQSIRQRAYEIWDALGRPDGDPDQHWLAAEREILAGAAQAVVQATTKTASKKKITRRRTARIAKIARSRASKAA